MSIIEGLRNLRGKKPSTEADADVERARKISIIIHDITNAAVAKEKGLQPGYYFEVAPISPKDAEKEDLLQELSVPLMTALQKEKLLASSDTRIPLKDQMYVDPAQGWRFALAAYSPEKQIVLVYGIPQDRDVAQRVIVTALRRR